MDNGREHLTCEVEECVAVFVDKVFVLDFSGHHDECLHDGGRRVDVEALVVGKEDAKAQGERHQQAKVGGQKLGKVLGHCCEHLHVDAERRQSGK